MPTVQADYKRKWRKERRATYLAWERNRSQARRDRWRAAGGCLTCGTPVECFVTCLICRRRCNRRFQERKRRRLRLAA